MAQVWSTGPAHIYVGVTQVQVAKPKSAPSVSVSMSAAMGDQGGGAEEGKGNGNKQALMRFADIPPIAKPNGNSPQFMKPIFVPPSKGGGSGPKPISQQPSGQSSQTMTVSKQARIPEYLGTAERAPFIDIVEAEEPWYTDEGGHLNPVDFIFMGETATVTVLVTRFSQFVLDRVHSRPNPVNGTSGRNRLKDFGHLAGLERGSFPLYIDFPNAVLPIYAGLPNGYRFWFAKLVSSQIVPGTKAQTAALKFACRQAWQATSHSRPEAHAPVEKGAIEAVLYDHDLSLARSIGPS